MSAFTVEQNNQCSYQPNGVKVVKATFKSILTKTKRIRLGDDTPAYAYFVVGFSDSIDQYQRYGMTPYVTIYKTEAEAQEYCEGKVVSYKEFHVDSEQDIDALVEANKKAQERYACSLAETY